MTRLEGPARTQLALIAAVQVLAMATWFSASAVVPALRGEWGISQGEATWLTASVQLGFVTGAVLAAVFSLPDRVPAHRLVAGSALAGAATTACVAAFADGLATAVPLRFATGVALAGVYPPGLKLMASWFDRGRGFALGALVGALTLGSSLPQLITGVADLPWRSVLYVSCALAVAGALLAARTVRPGPYAAPAPPFAPRYIVALFRDRGPRLANLGYLGHMWELYAVWTWLPAYIAAGQAARQGDAEALPPGVTAFLAIGVAGVAGCLLAGRLGDRVGRARLAALAMVTSGTCCLLAALVFGGHPLLVTAVLIVWGASVIADSGLFSACVSEVADPRYVGTALTTQTAAGFLLTVLTIQLTPLLAEAAGWRAAVAVLGIGPLAGAIAMVRLQRHMTPAHPAATGRTKVHP
ncbi:MFS transporter [Acrocarpospora phusangensis]|uniref:MFS transporter n=1 Tax=Acrocarpospora phusangensis TaxID=1070424 RepID=A0A919QCU6_9ACTN|nr:MFS transporter [Acrocarpospora phusangensis]GIH25020.1 MFS transporter [Acrocarpospora phusangensis]